MSLKLSLFLLCLMVIMNPIREMCRQIGSGVTGALLHKLIISMVLRKNRQEFGETGCLALPVGGK